MQQGLVIELGQTLAIAAAELSTRTGSLLADAVIYSTSQAYKATLWTQDKHFAGMPQVEYRRRRSD